MKKFLLKTTLLLCALIVGSGSAWAADVTLTAGTNGSACKVNNQDGIKLGTSSKGGDMTITVPANTTKLILHAAAWKGVTGLSLNISNATASPSSLSLTADEGISNNSPFTLSGDESNFVFEITLSDITTETAIKFATSTTKRCVIWGASAEIGGGNTPSLEDSDFALTGPSVALSFDLYNNSTPQVISYTTSSTGAVTVDENEYIETKVNETDKTITVTPKKITNAVQTIKVNQASDGTYAAGSATFTVSIGDSTPFTGGDVTFEGGTDKGTSTSSNDGDEVSKAVVTISSTKAAFNFSEYRIYSGSTTTLSAASGIITKIVFTQNGTYDLSNLSTSAGSYDSATGTWTGNAKSVEFSASAQVRLDKIVVTVDLDGTPAPVLSADNVNIAYDATNGSVEFTLTNSVEGGIVTAESSENWLTVGTISGNTVPFTCDANDAAKARTAVVTLTYTYNTNETVTKNVTVTQAAAPVVYATIPALFEAATSTATDVTINFGGWVVSAVKNSNAYLTDNQGNGLIVYASGHGFQVNDVLTGTVSCKLQLYRGSAELTELTSTTTGLTVTPDGTVTAQTIAISELSGVNTGALLAYEGLTYNGTALVDGSNNTITPYNTLYSATLEGGKTYNVTGVYLQYNTTKEILPRSAADIEEVILVTVTDAGYATFYSDYDVAIPAGVTAYYAEDATDGLVMHEVKDGKIKGGVGVVLEAAEKTYYFEATTGAAETAYTALKGVTTATEKSATDAEKEYWYVLGMNGDTPMFFLLEGTLGANKAYYPAPSKKASAMGLRWEGTTNISNMEVTKEKDIYFDLMGRPVQQPQRGIYIVNGRKMLVK